MILRPAYVHAAKDVASSARAEAAAIIEQRSTSPRYYANALVFLAADRIRLEELEQAARQYLAWKSIEDEQEILNLDAFQRNQARSRREHSDGAIKARIPETYSWLLVPEPSEYGSANVKVSLREIRLQPVQESLAVRASRKLENDGLLITKYAGTTLRLELDKVPLWRGDSVSLKQLADDFAQYLYLPRLRDTDVLLAAVRDGVAAITWERETFAYADSYDATHHRYLGLKAGQQIIPALDGMLVKPGVAAAQVEIDMASTAQPIVSSSTSGHTGTSSAGQRQPVTDGGTAVSEPTQTPAAPTGPQPQRGCSALRSRSRWRSMPSCPREPPTTSCARSPRTAARSSSLIMALRINERYRLTILSTLLERKTNSCHDHFKSIMHVGNRLYSS